MTLHVYAEDDRMFQDVIRAAMSGLYGIFAFGMVFGLLNMVNMLINSAMIRKLRYPKSPQSNLSAQEL